MSAFDPLRTLAHRGNMTGVADDTETQAKKPFDEWWVERTTGGFDRWPEWLRIIVILWTLLSVLFVAIDEFHTNVPRWFGWVMVAPYALLLSIVVIPAMFGRWLGWLTWPVRKLVRLIRRS
jgi:hypothetical protein